ncbi:NUDIX domain-containing protein [Bradyrhizobium guangdongense]
MNQPRVRDFSAAILIDNTGRLLLQRRDNKPDIAQPGKISFFGGGREEGESPLDCIVREIEEEVGASLPPSRFEHLTSLDVPDPENASGHVKGEYFIAREICTADLVVTEGQLLVIDPENIETIRDELTPLTKLVLRQFFAGQAATLHRSVLFLCTGNYYRSRYAEELFNHRAENEGLSWRAFSRGAAERGSPDNVGFMSPFALERLETVGIAPKRADQLPQPCSLADLYQAHLVIALKETEHRAMVERRFPEAAHKVQYWQVDDIDVADPADALPMLERLVASLIIDLRSARLP